VLAARLLEEKTDITQKITEAFRLIVCRKPVEKELQILTDYYNKQNGNIDSEDINKMLSVGEYPIPKDIDRKNLAALMRVVTTIYNMEETITKS